MDVCCATSPRSTIPFSLLGQANSIFPSAYSHVLIPRRLEVGRAYQK